MVEKRIREYIIEGLLGRGGMGSVYLATHIHLKKKAALKVLLEQFSEDLSIKTRFVNEASLLHDLQHKNIVQQREFFEENGRLVLVMEYVDGRPLDKMIGQDVGPIPWEKALPLFIQILDGIGYAHSKGIVHRDIKPANILISKEGQVKVTDLGIAKIAGEQGMTRTGAQMGTLYYESPEQIKGAKDVDHRSDIYSLGMTLYEMLAGRLPFDKGGDTSEFELMIAVVQRKENLDPREFYPHIPEWLVKIIQKATDLNPEKRFQSCEHFKQIMEKYGKLSATESTFWSGKVASVKSAPIATSKSVSNQTKQSSSSKGKNCPMCSEPVEKEMAFCLNCGANLNKTCPKCSSAIRWFAEFCPRCGTSIEDYLVKQAEETKQKELQEERKRKEVEDSMIKEFEEQERKRIEEEIKRKIELEEQERKRKETVAKHKRNAEEYERNLQQKQKEAEEELFRKQAWRKKHGWKVITTALLLIVTISLIGYQNSNSYAYKQALALEESGQWLEAFNAFEKLDDYGDSESRAISLRFSESDGSIFDRITNLEWSVLVYDSDANWNLANLWVDRLGGNWRMPSLYELGNLYDAGITCDNWGGFQNSGTWVWSSQTEGSSSAWIFEFNNGVESHIARSYYYRGRTFAVRLR